MSAEGGSMIEILSDKIKVNAEYVDGTVPVVIEVSEYQRDKIGEIFSLPRNASYKVTIEVVD